MKIRSLLLPFAAVLCSALNAQIQANRSYDVYDSVGVNTHWTAGLPFQYLQSFSTLVSKLQQANIHHIRDGQWGSGSNTQPWVTSMWSQLNAAGIKSNLIIVSNNNLSQTVQQLDADLKLYPGLESIEVMNEWDLGGGPDWVNSMLARLPVLHQVGVDLGVPVIGPSLVEGSSFAKLGDISRYITYGNIHDYQGNRNPETPGWGNGYSAEGHEYGSTLWNVDMAHGYAPGLPVIATEMGYQTGGFGPKMPETVEGTYAPRIILAGFNRGVPRTYIYQLLDDPFGWSSWGLLHYDLSPKPAFTAISNLLSILKDDDTQFTPESLNYSISGNTTGLETMLVEKSAGDFYLALWLDGSIYDPDKQVPTPIAPQQVTVAIPAGLIISGVSSFNPDGSVTSTASNQSFYTVNANSCVTLLHISHASSAVTPVLSVQSGNYTSIQTLAITDATPGARIYYTTDGSAPATNSTLYNGPFPVASSETVQAIAAAPENSNSPVASANYTIKLPGAAIPAFSVSPGTYTSSFSVVIVDSTPGAKIYYTRDGSTPNRGSVPYSSPISVTSTQTINALAVAWGYNDSAVSSDFYTISGTAPSSLINSASKYRIVNQASGMCIFDGSTLASGNPVAQSPCYPGNTSQKWMFSPSSDAGYYTVTGVNSAGGAVWTVSGGAVSDSSPVQQFAATNARYQHWGPVLLPTGYYQLVDANSGLCLAVPGGAKTNGLQLQISTCDGSPSQSFAIGSISTTINSGAWYEALNGMSGMCISDPHASVNDGTTLIQATCGSLLNQEWQFQPTDSGYAGVHNGSVVSLVWDDTAGSTANGNTMQLWTWYGNSNQQWIPNLHSNGLWTFANRTSGACLDNSNSTGSGTRMTQWMCGSWNPNQQFELLRVR